MYSYQYFDLKMDDLISRLRILSGEYADVKSAAELYGIDEARDVCNLNYVPVIDYLTSLY